MHFDLTQSELAKNVLSTSKEVQSVGEEKLFIIFLFFNYIIEESVSVKSLQSDICKNFFPSKIVKFKPTTTFENANNHFRYVTFHRRLSRGKFVVYLSFMKSLPDFFVYFT
jgi:hypothetical protein